ncbi:hypothetical protein NZNM25_08090 [Nitrosopumilus zosterae]|uniref:Uncharacterized protein n=1 Tax=Nitrosopumilus zosterae TaxID=718286 RepID=A0A2S2KRE2_9ARCH|nr:hypothetical protein NZNM25_08090 [Nitrosopumilus zosterae]
MSLLKPVSISKRILENKTNILNIPLRFVNFKRTKVITVTEIARMVRNPVFIPKIKKREDAISPACAVGRLNRSIFSGDAKRGTLKTALTKNKINSVIDTVLTWF